MTTGRCLVLWLAQAIVSGARSGESNGSREHTSEKRRKDRRCGRLGSVRHLIISFAREPHLLLGENLGRNGPQFRATRGLIQARFSPAVARWNRYPPGEQPLRGPITSVVDQGARDKARVRSGSLARLRRRPMTSGLPSTTDLDEMRERVRLVPCVDGSGLARAFFTVLQHWSVQPCVRPVGAVHMTAGHNALRGSGPDQHLAFKNALAHVG